MDGEELYDEFGNYIGPDLDSSEESEEEEEEEEEEEVGDAAADDDDEGGDAQGRMIVEHAGGDEDAQDGAMVLHEDKKYYPDAEEVYPDAEVLVQDEDTQPLEQPVVAPVKTKKWSVLEKTLPDMRFTPEFVGLLMQQPTLVRHVVLLGHLHHGKTSLVDVFAEQAQTKPWDPAKNVRYCDTREDEQVRGLSIKSTPISLALPATSGKHYLINMMDCPGHLNFSDESTAGIRAADGAVIVVDAVEGVMIQTERLIRHAAESGIEVMLCITKVDRLVHELKLPPTDAYFKLLHTISEVNKLLEGCASGVAPKRLSPELGNVCFASGLNGWCFTLGSFAKIYTTPVSWRWYMPSVDYVEFAKRLWGDIWYNPSERNFVGDKSKTSDADMPRTFVHFILEPLYKIYSQVLGEEPHALKETLGKIGVKLSRKQLHLDPKPLLKLVLTQFFGKSTGWVDMPVGHDVATICKRSEDCLVL